MNTGARQGNGSKGIRPLREQHRYFPLTVCKFSPQEHVTRVPNSTPNGILRTRPRMMIKYSIIQDGAGLVFPTLYDYIVRVRNICRYPANAADSTMR